ncbi:MAG: c-type cytochrome [Candidatus Omnitrophica bacterium]|nr:c-type cytochrome [Candidatus Omnitrophota bacterium]
MMKKFIFGLAVGVIVLCLIPILVMGSGIFNVGASNDPGYVETKISQWTVDNSVSRNAPDMTNPYSDDSEAISVGRDHYRETCVQCHGAPGIEPAEFAVGLNPPAPDLAEETSDLTDGELFWITKHGIRMTGMPAFGQTHDENEIWKIVAFVRELPNLSQEDLEALKSNSEGGHHHDHAQNEEENHQNHTMENPHGESVEPVIQDETSSATTEDRSDSSK